MSNVAAILKTGHLQAAVCFFLEGGGLENAFSEVKFRRFY